MQQKPTLPGSVTQGDISRADISPDGVSRAGVSWAGVSPAGGPPLAFSVPAVPAIIETGPIETGPVGTGAANSLDAPVTLQDIFRLQRLLWIFGLLLAVLVAPSIIARIQYAATAAKERAHYDIARELKQEFSLSSFSDASRLLANYVGPSVVSIRTSGSRGEGQGSGVIVDSEGYVVTNFHVVEFARSVELQLSDGRRGVATVVGADPLVDLAVLKTEMGNLTAAKWGDSDELDVGEMVWALGSPYGLQKSITFGIVSAKERRGIPSQRHRRPSVYQEFLQTDAAVNPGNSGGPLVNVDGEIVGINTAIYGHAYSGISFSIPSSIARNSYEQLRKDGWVLRGYLGVVPTRVPDQIARALGLDRNQGVYVAKVQENTPAAEAGLKRSDVILSWDGVEHSDPTLMSRAIAATPIGTQVPVEVMRLQNNKSKRLTLTVKVAARPMEDSL